MDELVFVLQQGGVHMMVVGTHIRWVGGNNSVETWKNSQRIVLSNNTRKDGSGLRVLV